MREIEIKARCSDLGSLVARLVDAGVEVSSPVTQDDQVYGLPGEKGDDTNTFPWLRIREEESDGVVTTTLTLKKTVTNQLDSIEHETQVANVNEAKNIILHIGFEPYVRVKKTRQKAHVGDIELCIDNVEGLGTFVEAEKLTADDADYDTIATELWYVFDTFGITKHDEVTDGYDVLMRKHLGAA